uniref:Uncharacterized protein n=1 Tax=Proboscia inermis TaxID=420281 RepID=A0A7S0C4L5_9STRA|mmetsp:Transcript_24689/g.25104  ORF Transcript_24689/g.25104 Transcript_24689/m.25104 type:complete len:122 (+) Transcript_24689:194-559(+)
MVLNTGHNRLHILLRSMILLYLGSVLRGRVPGVTQKHPTNSSYLDWRAAGTDSSTSIPHDSNPKEQRFIVLHRHCQGVAHVDRVHHGPFGVLYTADVKSGGYGKMVATGPSPVDETVFFDG